MGRNNSVRLQADLVSRIIFSIKATTYCSY